MMSKANALAGLIGNYDDSDDDSDGGAPVPSKGAHATVYAGEPPLPGASAAFAAPPGTIHPAPVPHCPWSACYDETSGYTYYWNQNTNAVTWEAPPEYLLALKIAQQHLTASGTSEVSAEEWQLYQQALAEKQKSKVIAKPPAVSKLAKKPERNDKKRPVKRRVSDDDEKIELITSYYNSDSDSNEETQGPQKPPKLEPPKAVTPKPKPTVKVPAKKAKKPVEYGPSLPPNQEYTVPIGPELPPELMVTDVEKTKDSEVSSDLDKEESELFKKLKDKAKLLEKLGGEIPTELQKIIREDSPKDENSCDGKLDTNIDDLLDEIERKELPKIKSKKNTVDSPRNSPISKEEFKPLFPVINSEEPIKTFPKTMIENGTDTKSQETEKKNIYLSESVNTNKKKLRMSTVLPTVPYTTKYSQHIEGFGSERTGLGFSSETEIESPKSTVKYGNGLLFTKGETLNEGKSEELQDLVSLVEDKLKYLNELQPCVVTPVQEMLIQLQTLKSAHHSGALALSYLQSWSRSASNTLSSHEVRAAPPGWTCRYTRSMGRYRYVRESDGFVQYEYPAADDTDMDICTTPPHPGITETKADPPPPPTTPPPPAWSDPPPPGVDEPTQESKPKPEPKPQAIDELQSFYNDIAQLEKQIPKEPAPESNPHTASNSPEPPHTTEPKEKKEKICKKKSKVKISSAIGMKQKTVSSLVAKWQQVAEEINSD